MCTVTCHLPYSTAVTPRRQGTLLIRKNKQLVIQIFRLLRLDVPVAELDLDIASHDVHAAGLDLDIASHDVPAAGLDLDIAVHDVPAAGLDLDIASYDVHAVA